MMMQILRRVVLSVAVAVSALSLGSAPAWACSACFGDPQSNIAKGALWGVVVLGGVTYCLLMCLAGTGIFWYVRSRRLARTQPIPGEE